MLAFVNVSLSEFNSFLTVIFLSFTVLPKGVVECKRLMLTCIHLEVCGLGCSSQDQTKILVLNASPLR